MTEETNAQQMSADNHGESERWFDASWTKVHPLSPIVRGGLAVVAIPGILLSYNWQTWVDAWEAFRSGEIQRSVESNPQPFLLGGLGVLLIIVLIFAGFALSWWFTRYKITAEHVMVKSGILVRQHRQARIDRVQAVDLRQPLLARITGLAELKFEVAEGDGTAATLAFLKRSQAEEIRSEIMDRAAGKGAPLAEVNQPEDGHHPSPAPATHGDFADPTYGQSSQDFAQPDRQIAKVPPGRLIGSVLTGWGTVLLSFILVLGLIFLAIAVVTEGFGEGNGAAQVWAIFGAAILPAALPLGIAAATVYYQQFSSGFGFTSTATTAGLRIRYGLLETTNQTIPPGRIQAIQVQQPVMWRPFGWFKIVVTVAGYGTGEKRSVLLPVGKLDDVMATAAEMFPDLQVENPEEVFTAGLVGQGTDLDFTEVPRRARFFDPIVRRRRGFRTTPAVLMFRDGRASRRLTMIPHERVQSLSTHQGPLQRRREIADIFIHSPAGPFQARLKNQDLQAVKDLFEYESEHAAQARRYSDRNHWMRPEELQEFERKAAEAVAPVSGEPNPGDHTVAAESLAADPAIAPSPAADPSHPVYPDHPQEQHFRER